MSHSKYTSGSFRLLGLLVLLLSYGSGYAQGGDRAVRPIPTVTLTEGAYPEVFENDTLRWVGNALFNTRLGRVVVIRDGENRYRYGFQGQIKDDKFYGATETSSDFGARLYDPRIGKWLACDPLAVKYPDLSPYSFAANNPILFIDPNGKEIHVTDPNTGKVHIFKPGDAVPNGASKFVQDSYAGLNYLHGFQSKDNLNRVDFLVKSDRVLDVSQSLDAFTTKFNAGGGNLIEGRSLRWNNYQLNTFADGTASSPINDLGHELDHAAMFFMAADNCLESGLDEDCGKLNDSFFGGEKVSEEEQRVTRGFETELSKELGQHVRTDYYGPDGIPAQVGATGDIFSTQPIYGPVEEAVQKRTIDGGNQRIQDAKQRDQK